jgi:hypothetical protein
VAQNIFLSPSLRFRRREFAVVASVGFGEIRIESQARRDGVFPAFA